MTHTLQSCPDMLSIYIFCSVHTSAPYTHTPLSNTNSRLFEVLSSSLLHNVLSFKEPSQWRGQTREGDWAPVSRREDSGHQQRLTVPFHQIPVFYLSHLEGLYIWYSLLTMPLRALFKFGTPERASRSVDELLVKTRSLNVSQLYLHRRTPRASTHNPLMNVSFCRQCSWRFCSCFLVTIY